ncbi:LysE family transporter [Streptomyces sp. NPDC002073]
MSELTTTALAGAAAGLGVAMPVGAIGVLLVQESMRGPRRAAAAAAAAVAVVDMAYAALATALGPLVSSALSGVEAWVRLLSALILLAIAAHGLRPTGSPASTSSAPPSSSASRSAGLGYGPATGPDAAPGSGTTTSTTVSTATTSVTASTSAGGFRTFLRFAALTAVNPTTALYFAALTTAQGATLAGGTAGAVFVGAVFAASLVWQQLLVLAGSFAGSRISAAARVWTFRVGYGLVALYAVKIALPLP